MADNIGPMPELNPLQRAFNLFLVGLGPNQLEEILEFIRHNQGNDVYYAQNNFIRQTEDVVTAMNENISNAPQVPAGNNRGARAKGQGDRKLRPLNSFIAFRSYYSTMFTDMTQKAKSGIIKFLWQNDPFKAKWAILAKAYSNIRDKHGREVSLDTFLNLTVPFIGLIEPTNYLGTMGWHLTMSEDNQYNVEKDVSVRVDLSNTSTNLSVADIVNYCYGTGYVVDDQRLEEPEQGPVVPFAAQPNANIIADNAVINLDNVNRPLIEDDTEPATVNCDANEQIETPNTLMSYQSAHPINYHFYEDVDTAVRELRQLNGGDSELYAPFNPAVEMPAYDPLVHGPFETFNLDDINF